MKRIIKMICVSAILMTVMTGCVPKNKNVVVTNYPVQFLFERLAGDRVNVQRIDKGSVPQRATIDPNYQEILKNADAIFYINELQPYWEMYRDVMSDNSKIEMVDLAEKSTLYRFQRYTTSEISGQVVTTESPYYDGIKPEDVDLYENDPFLWMDPLAMTSMARSIKDWLDVTYPDERKTFETRFNELEVELTDLQAHYNKLKSNHKPIRVVTMTPSFGNWQKSYNVEVYPMTISRYGVLPDETALQEIRTRIMADDVRYIAYEEGMPDDYVKLFNQLKTELDLKTINLSSVYTLTDAEMKDKQTYIYKMYQNLETLETIAAQ
ncbi:zinc ABC transporter substrate-binding protein [Erysipelothrix inopinata]|uniref:Zinc ABC transporter substrate-binding protein n=1 Tax=Erysipelothrix inopinata TaxID=225084 RepID=A0A7G9RY07_9FIRM|nr:zinc ABC transporter substrate-binding protein [Erysipelothrix inopinata]QNN60482.1 zinc ABC transporter substrate-binding protein [Erysipelothrix inopinata]